MSDCIRSSCRALRLNLRQKTHAAWCGTACHDHAGINVTANRATFAAHPERAGGAGAQRGARRRRPRRGRAATVLRGGAAVRALPRARARAARRRQARGGAAAGGGARSVGRGGRRAERGDARRRRWAAWGFGPGRDPAAAGRCRGAGRGGAARGRDARCAGHAQPVARWVRPHVAACEARRPTCSVDGEYVKQGDRACKALSKSCMRVPGRSCRQAGRL